MRKAGLMEYIISFLEGIITFISPCMLPMLPVYISYFSGSADSDRTEKNRTLLNAVGFVIGFTVAFVILGAFSGTAGRFLQSYAQILNVIFGIIIIIFGLNFMGVLNLPFIGGGARRNVFAGGGFFSSVLFGVIFSVSWTPCVGAFLGSALMLAAQGGNTLKGILMLFAFSMGLGIPFIVSALLIDRLKSAFDFIKRHYRVINIISGSLLVIIGILMATGLLGYFFALFTF